MSQNEISFRILHHEDLPPAMGLGASVFFGLHGESAVSTSAGPRPLLVSEVYVVPPLTLYQVSCPEGAGLLQMILPPGILKRAGWSERLPVDCWLRRSGLQNAVELEVRQRCAAVFRAFFQQGGGASPDGGEAVALATLLRERFSDSGAPPAETGAESLRLLERAMRQIRTCWREPISLSALAAGLFVSESYLSRVFRKHLGMTFTEYLVSVRLENAVQELRAGRSVTETAYRSGFPSSNAFISCFKRAYGITPGRYRSLREGSAGHAEDVAEWVQELLQYDAGPAESRADTVVRRQARIDVSRSAGAVSRSWEKLVNIGYARDGLLGAVQEQLRRAQNELGFRYLRFHGIFDDDMHIYQQNPDGSPWYNFTYADLLFDFILSIGLTPYVELGFVPSRLAKTPYRLLDRNSMSSACADLERWEALVQAAAAHWIERYGLEAVCGWRFSAFSYNYAVMEEVPVSYEDYLEMYLVTRRALKSLDPRLSLGGPGAFSSLLLTEPDLIVRLFDDLLERGALPDFLTAQCYPHENIFHDAEFLRFTASQQSAPSVLSKDEDYTAHFLKALRAFAGRYRLDTREIVIEEWTSTLWQRDLSSDTCYKSAWLVKNALENDNGGVILGYWLLTDLIEEWFAPRGTFHGGYGLFTADGVPKAGWQALRLLACAGEERVSSGEGWFVARTGGTVQVYLYHYCHYDTLYRYRYQKLGDPRDAYKVFRPGGTLELSLTLCGLSPGIYRQERRAISRSAGSSYDKWLEMGAPSALRPDDLQYLTEASQPDRALRDVFTNGTLLLEARLEPHEVQLIVLQKRDC